MKTRQSFLFALICLTFGFCSSNQAQNSNVQFSQFIEQSFGDQVYVYDTLTRFIQNKKNYIYELKDDLPYGCDCHVAMIESYEYIFDKIFSVERKKELKELTISMIAFSDSLGNIVEINFRVLGARNILMLRVQEVNALEKAFLKYKIKIYTPHPNKKYCLFTMNYWFTERKKPC